MSLRIALGVLLFFSVIIKSYAEKSCDSRKLTFQECFYMSVGSGVSIVKYKEILEDQNLTNEYSEILPHLHLGVGYHFLPRWFTEVNYMYTGELDHSGGKLNFHDLSFALGWYAFDTQSLVNFYIAPSVTVRHISEMNTENRLGDENVSIDYNRFAFSTNAGIELNQIGSPWLFKIDYGYINQDHHSVGIRIVRYLGHAEDKKEDVSFDFVTHEVVYFGTNSAELSLSEKMKLDTLLSSIPYEVRKYLKIEVYGHTDDIGEADYNQILSQKRADTVADYLEKNNFDSRQIVSIGMGEEELIYDSMQQVDRKSSRRSNIWIH